MPNITFDEQSFMIDGRRVWLVSAAMHYTRTPRPLWRSRIRAAKQAGCNCIETYVFWNVHEPQAGRFRFDGDYDLRHFVQLVGEEGLYCIVRPGPYVCSEWDFGGLPAWLHTQGQIKLREGDPTFLQATARYLDAVMQQIADLQITRPAGGPVILIQNENEWFCHNDEAAEAYLEAITRYLRESRCEVPLINCNNLWQHVPGTIDCWNGWNRLADDCRQLRIAQPGAPRLITEFWPGWFDSWGRPHADGKSADEVLQRLAEISATGAMANLYMFHGGTNFGFYGGRTVGAPDMYMTTSYDYNAPLLEAGGRGRKYKAVKRLCTFLSQFADVMAHMDSDHQPTHAVAAGSNVSVCQQSGVLGTVAFIIREPARKDRTVELLTPMGQRLPVHLGHSSAAWVLLDAKLAGVARLDLTNLRPWAFVAKRMLVLFGPAGTRGMVSIDGAMLLEDVPKGKSPFVTQHQNLTVVILNEDQVDEAYLHDDGRLFVGIGGFDTDDEPFRGDSGSYTIVNPDGTVARKRFDPPARLAAPRLDGWEVATLDGYVDGTAPRYAAIDGPQSLEACGADFGYGWYRLRQGLKGGRRIKLLIPQANDRLHIYVNGVLKTVYGFGPGAETGPVDFQLPSGECTIVGLADNLGRLNYGTNMGERKGLFGHLMAVKPIKPKKAEETVEAMADPFAVKGYVPHCRKGDRSPRRRFHFTVSHRRKSPLVLVLHGERPRSVVIVNDQPVAIDPGQNLTERIVLDPETQQKQGNNRITFALIEPAPDRHDPRKHVDVYEAAELISESAEWSYARWQMPDEGVYRPLPAKASGLGPCWFRAAFALKQNDVPLFLEINGMSKGQIYINGHNAGRYFVATQTGKKVPPQSRYYLPEPWLNVNEENELILFDEHGRTPDKCKLVYDAMGPYGDQ